MKFLSIAGLKNDFDRVMNVYLNKYEIHLENALYEFNTLQSLNPFVEVNPYKNQLAKSLSLLDKISPDCVPSNREMTPKEAADIIDEAVFAIKDLSDQRREIKERNSHFTNLIHQIEPFRQLKFDMCRLMDFKFIDFRFGKIAHEHFRKFTDYVYDGLETIFYECDSDKDYVWGIYFVPKEYTSKVDSVYASFHFDRIIIPDEYEGTPEDSFQTLLSTIRNLRKELNRITTEIKTRLNDRASDLLLAHQTLENLTHNFDVRKLAACTSEKDCNTIFYILCGWLTQKDCDILLNAISGDPNVYCLSEEEDTPHTSKPPTKLRNPKIFKPFELFIHMYGLPAYNEMDPTIFVALTYTFMFGVMFGDVGQGLVLTIGGALIYKYKKVNLAAVLSVAGIWSIFFGFMYGSIFGFEEVLHAIWMRPMDNIMSTLGIAIGFGACLILIAMIINIVNGIRSKDIEKIFFDASGIAGLICYGSVIACVILVLTGHELPATIILAVIIGLPLLAITFKEPLTRLIQKESSIFPEGSKAMYLVQALVEVFDVVLSYATNTISFVRLGAFALSHVGMMGVVFTLAGATKGDPNILVIIIGNILVTGLEGLVVGIQVLRLEYYEMFSRFYKGNGRAFTPFNAKQ